MPETVLFVLFADVCHDAQVRRIVGCNGAAILLQWEFRRTCDDTVNVYVEKIAAIRNNDLLLARLIHMQLSAVPAIIC